MEAYVWVEIWALKKVRVFATLALRELGKYKE